MNWTAVDLEPALLNTIGFPVHFSKTVMDLVSNAVEALPEEVKVTISTQNIHIDRPIQSYEDMNVMERLGQAVKQALENA